MSDVGARTWLSLHAYAHSDLDAQLARLVAPAKRVAINNDAVSWFFLRYWDGGPHVRLRVLLDRPERADLAARQLEVKLDQWAENNPDPRPMADREYQESLSWVSQREVFIGKPSSLRPSRTVKRVPFHGEWMPDAPSCTHSPTILAVLTASSDLALHLHERGTWAVRFRHAIDVARQALGDRTTGPGGASIGRELDVWARHLAADQAEAVASRCDAHPLGRWQAPHSAAVTIHKLCREVADEAGDTRSYLHAWHTHCNRLGLSLLDEAAAAWIALRVEREVVQ